MKKYTGKTLNDVLNSAAKEKGVSVEELTYFVTEEKQGFLYAKYVAPQSPYLQSFQKYALRDKLAF